MIMQNRLRKLLLLTSFLGTGAFFGAFLVSMFNPVYVEHLARDILRVQLERSVGEKLDAIDNKFLTSQAGSFIMKHSEEARRARQALRDQVPERISALIGQMGHVDCECRKNVEIDIREYFTNRAISEDLAQQGLTSLIRSQYMQTAQQLTREFRIFTLTNALVFILLGVAAYRRRNAQVQLMPVSLALVAAAGISAYLYIYKQDWMHTLLFNDYLGLMYLVYLGLCFALLCDVLFNRARVTTGALHMVGLAIPIAPC